MLVLLLVSENIVCVCVCVCVCVYVCVYVCVCVCISWLKGKFVIDCDTE